MIPIEVLRKLLKNLVGPQWSPEVYYLYNVLIHYLTFTHLYQFIDYYYIKLRVFFKFDI